MKGRGMQHKKGKKNTSTLQKYMVSVDKFVQSKVGESDEAEDTHGLRFVKKKSRKELRRDKRKLKKAKRKGHYEGKSSIADTDNVDIPSDKTQPKKTEKAKKDQPTSEKAKKDQPTRQKAKKDQPTSQKAKDEPTSQKAKKDEPTSQKKPKTVQFEDSIVEKSEPVKTRPKRDPNSKKGKKKNRLEESRKMALLEANVAEDKEIKKLERFLGMNKRKNKKNLPQSFTDDGLDYILGVLDADPTASGIYDGEDDMDNAKENFKKLDDDDSEMSGEEDEVSGDEGSAQDNEGELDSIDEDDEDEMEDDDEEEEGEEEDEMEADGEEEDDDEMEADEDDVGMDESVGEEESEEGGKTASEETKTPETKDGTAASPAGKYVPPHLRDAADGKRKAELERLKRTIKGLVNRLSEANMASISGQLEELYMNSSRKDMSDTLTEVLLAACVTPALLPDRLLMEHVLLVSVLHHTVGLEVGAHFLETAVRKFDEVYKTPSAGKECDNLVAIVAHLYNFQVVHAVLIFDILKRLVAAFSEKDIELVLFVLRNVGFGLRKDDALALKELIAEAQRKASGVDTKSQDQARVRFMLETMMALKNNDMRKIPGYDPEPVEKLRKLQRTLIGARARGSDVKLRVSLENLLVADQVGRWWIVGSSWSGAPMIGDNKAPKQASAEGQFSAKVLDLARKQRMNTEVRRNIFCVVMTSEDYLDAFEKLLGMGLKNQQEREIVHVLMDCCLQEKSFNAFYAVLGEKFCAHNRQFQMTFQFSLWDKFKDLASLTSSTFSNLVQLVTRFLQKKCLSLSLLKAIEFAELDKYRVRFLRQVLTKLLLETPPEDLETIFGRISGIPKLGMLREGLKLFISHFLLKNASSQGPAEQAAVLSERAQVATAAMEAKEAKLKL